MANFSFASLNSEHKGYLTLEELYKKNGKDAEYQILNVWLNLKSKYNPESPVIEIAEANVNIPQHQLHEVKKMIADAEIMGAILAGECGFKIRTYTKTSYEGKGKARKEVTETFYAAEWIDVDPDDYPDYGDDDDE